MLEDTTTARPRGLHAGRAYSVGWGSVVAIGVLLIALGMLALGGSFAAGLVTVAFLGGLLVAGGVAEMIGAFRVRSRGFAAPFLAGLLSAIVGALVIWQPIAGLAAVTLVLSLHYLASGLFRGITALVDRYEHWGWDVAFGVLATLLGAYLLAAWPVSSLVLVGTLVGVELILRGAAWIAGGLTLRRVGNVARDAIASGRVAAV